MEKYFHKSIEETMKYFNVSKNGLNSKETKNKGNYMDTMN